MVILLSLSSISHLSWFLAIRDIDQFIILEIISIVSIGSSKYMGEMKKILVVDDDEIHLSMAETMLKSHYEVITTKSGKEALEYLFKGAAPDLILLDILMPDLDGWETFNRLKAISFLKEVPIVFLTSVTESAEVQHAQEIGAADYITKPYKKSELLGRIEKVLMK
jgi:CheY-like chemotaxis protein